MSETPQDTQVNLGSVKRWYPTIVYDGLGYEPVAYAEMAEIEDGDWVRLQDYAEKCAEITNLFKDAITRSGYDISLCANCSKLVVCLPDGMSNWCEECAKKEGNP